MGRDPGLWQGKGVCDGVADVVASAGKTKSEWFTAMTAKAQDSESLGAK